MAILWFSELSIRFGLKGKFDLYVAKCAMVMRPFACLSPSLSLFLPRNHQLRNSTSTTMKRKIGCVIFFRGGFFNQICLDCKFIFIYDDEFADSS